MTAEQLTALKELAQTAADLGNNTDGGTFWPRACLQLIEELERRNGN
jgi:hypothetical protein